MALPTEELKRRIDAARTLRGLKQRELAALLEEDGLGKHDVGRLERGELDLRRVHLDALIRQLRMPEWWFTAPDVTLADEPPATVAERFDGLADQLDAIQAVLAVPRDDQAPAARIDETPDRRRPRESSGGDV